MRWLPRSTLMAIEILRTRLAPLAKVVSSNPGLTLSHYLQERDDNHDSAKELICRVAQTPAPDVYKTAFVRWKSTRKDSATLVGKLVSPLALGLGNESVLEAGITTQ